MLWKRGIRFYKGASATELFCSPASISESDRGLETGGTAPGPIATSWLATTEGVVRSQAGSPSAFKFQIPAWQNNCSRTRHPRYEEYGYTRVPWPHTRYQLEASPLGLYEDNRSGFLVSEKFPFFPDFHTALCEKVHLVPFGEQNQRMSPKVEIIARIAHSDAWLEDIHVSPTALAITVAGTHITGTRLEIMGASHLRFDQLVGSDGSVTCPLRSGLPTEWWVVLSRESRWLDYFHHSPYPGPSHQPPNVTMEPPQQPDLSVLIQEWVAGGEGQTTEFKQEVSEQPKEKDRFSQTVVAFANSDGGKVLIGVPNENPSILGFPGNVDHERVRLTNIIRDHLIEMPSIDIQHGEIEGKKVIVVFVEQGDADLYALKPTSASTNPRYYVRRGASNYTAQPGELSALVRKRTSIPVQFPNPYPSGW